MKLLLKLNTNFYDYFNYLNNFFVHFFHFSSPPSILSYTINIKFKFGKKGKGMTRLWFYLKWFEQFCLIFETPQKKKKTKETKKGLNIFEWILLKFRDVYTLPFITHQTFNIFWIEINERSFVYITIYKYVLYILNNDKWILD